MEHKNRPPEWYSHNVPPEHHHPHNEWLVDRCSDQCDDQLPLFSRVGRGLQGNGYKVEVEQPSDCETYLHGYIYDSATGTYISDWQSHNVNGGHLSYQYHLHPYGDPPTFTITFKYDRPCYDDEHDMSWEWTTPAIPYIAEAGGSGIGNLFIKPTTGATWTAVRSAVAESDLPTDVTETLAAYEKLVFPEGDTRELLQPPLPTDPWTVNLTYGKGGDIDCPTTAEAAADDAATLAAAKQYTDDNIPVVAAGPGISVSKSGRTYTVTHKMVPEGDIVFQTDSNGTLRISNSPTHLHKDLYGKNVTGHDYTSEITNLGLMPLGGDSGTKSVWDWIKYAIAQAKDYTDTAKKFITDKLGFGDNINNFDNLSGVDTVKKYIKKLISNIKFDVSNPKRYSVSHNVTFVLYALPETGITADTTLGISGATLPAVPNTPYNAPAGAPNTIDGQLVISYFDVLPEVSIDFVFNTATASTNFALVPAGHLLVACERGTRTPLNLANITLPNRDPQETGTPEKLKKPTATAEVLINVGYYPDDYYGNAGTFQVYAGIGNVIAKSINVGSTRYKGWPWTSKTPAGGAFYAYLMNRYTNGDVNTVVQIDYARNYFISYLQADPVS